MVRRAPGFQPSTFTVQLHRYGSTRKAFGAIDDEFGAGPNLLVNAPDILAENADADQLNAAEKRDEHHERRIAPDDWPIRQLVEEIDCHQQKRKARDDEPEPGAERQGIRGKTKN